MADAADQTSHLRSGLNTIPCPGNLVTTRLPGTLKASPSCLQLMAPEHVAPYPRTCRCTLATATAARPLRPHVTKRSEVNFQAAIEASPRIEETPLRRARCARMTAETDPKLEIAACCASRSVIPIAIPAVAVSRRWSSASARISSSSSGATRRPERKWSKYSSIRSVGVIMRSPHGQGGPAEHRVHSAGELTPLGLLSG